MIISLPVQTAVCPVRADGAFAVVVAVQVSIPGLYLAPVSRLSMILLPPQMIISLPVQSAVWPSRFDGALSAPDDHFTAAPNRCISVPTVGCVIGTGSCPTVCTGIIFAPAVQVSGVPLSTPDDHLTPAPHGSVQISAFRRVESAGSCPTICAGVVSAAGV